MNSEEFVKEISRLPISMLANFVISNWCIGSMSFSADMDVIF